MAFRVRGESPISTPMASQEIETLAAALARLPGLGPRSARRAVLWLVKRRETALTQLLGAAPLSRAQTADQSARVTTVTVDVQRFDMVPAQFALLAATWQVNPPASSKVPQRLTCYTEVSQSVAPGVAPLVQAQQQNIELLAQAISQAWHTGQVGAQTRCQ